MVKLHQRGGRYPSRGRFLTLRTAAGYTPMGLDFLAAEIRRGRGPAHYTFGSRTFLLREDIETWIASKRVAAGMAKASVCPRCGKPLA